jgi:hypothetical protein
MVKVCTMLKIFSTEETDKDETNQEWKGDDTNDDAATKSKQENQA